MSNANQVVVEAMLNGGSIMTPSEAKDFDFDFVRSVVPEMNITLIHIQQICVIQPQFLDISTNKGSLTA